VYHSTACQPLVFRTRWARGEQYFLVVTQKFIMAYVHKKIGVVCKGQLIAQGENLPFWYWLEEGIY